ncbi:hypothetical protein D9M68_416600 [compost metagenome]
MHGEPDLAFEALALTPHALETIIPVAQEVRQRGDADTGACRRGLDFQFVADHHDRPGSRLLLQPILLGRALHAVVVGDKAIVGWRGGTQVAGGAIE